MFCLLELSAVEVHDGGSYSDPDSGLESSSSPQKELMKEKVKIQIFIYLQNLLYTGFFFFFFNFQKNKERCFRDNQSTAGLSKRRCLY